MIAYGVPLTEIEKIVNEVSKEKYAGNIVIKDIAQKSGKAVNFTITVKSSKGKGSRVGHTGRAVAAACWHAHRDMMLRLFDDYPEARLVSAQADYRGAGDFLAKFDATGDINIGSMMQPLYFREACHCSDWRDDL